MKRQLLAAAGGVAGATLGGFFSLQGVTVEVALGLGFAAAVAGVLTGLYYDHLPDDDAWPVARWSAAFVGVTMLGTALALSHGGPLDAETSFALQLFVLATAWNAFVIGVVAAEERHRHGETTADAETDASADADGHPSTA